MSEHPSILTEAEACEYLGIDANELERLTMSGALPAWINTARVYLREDLNTELANIGECVLAFGKASMRAACIALIWRDGRKGLTCNEIELIPWQSSYDVMCLSDIEPICYALSKQGVIFDSGFMRLNPDGKATTVWVAPNFAPTLDPADGCMHADPAPAKAGATHG